MNAAIVVVTNGLSLLVQIVCTHTVGKKEERNKRKGRTEWGREIKEERKKEKWEKERKQRKRDGDRGSEGTEESRGEEEETLRSAPSLCRDGGLIPPAVRMVILSRSYIDKLFCKDGFFNSAYVFRAKMVV
ncbi:uncharacterized protein DS421_9g276430 [Arachis hypogaea]|nr:uncharacterized protein DS421_9g276430 [Arachis hypogaea]